MPVFQNLLLMMQDNIKNLNKTFRGLNRDGIITASLYVSSRVNDNPRTPKEIVIFHLDNTSATRGCKNAITISMVWNIILQTKKINYVTPPIMVDRYCSRLNINNELTTL